MAYLRDPGEETYQEKRRELIEKRRLRFYYDCLAHGRDPVTAERLSREAANAGVFFDSTDHKACGGD